uniref:Ig-like domain-containing protein n=1 Tax=Poecilia reticulata TaxID=8081 RepID=A0A3P9QJF6_POERE
MIMKLICCLLPCQIQLGSDPLIHWYQVSAGDLLVHSYYNGRDQLDHQKQNFQNRTSLILDQISRGNASLLLKEVKIQDEGRYKCYTSTRFLMHFLLFSAPVSDIRIHQDGNKITCSSEGIYPQPELTWSTEPPSNTALNETTIHQTEDQLYNISSFLMDPNNETDLIYSCSIRTRSSNRTETLIKPGEKTFHLLPVADPDPVSCVFRHSCLLPCQFQSGSGPEIRWSNPSSAGELLVHSYYDGQDQLDQQNQNFQGRTSLFLDQISRGNASLLLKEVKIQDEGRYKCNISTSFDAFFFLFLAPVSDIRIHQDGNRITCSSEGIYPQPELTWSTEPPSNTALQNRTTVHQTEEKLYDISSSLTGPDGSDLTYSCIYCINSASVDASSEDQYLSCLEENSSWIHHFLSLFCCCRCKKDGNKEKGDEKKKSKDSKKGESETFGNFSEESE